MFLTKDNMDKHGQILKSVFKFFEETVKDLPDNQNLNVITETFVSLHRRM